jgi:hypothetical protein
MTVEPTENTVATIQVNQREGYFRINFERVIDAVEYFENYNPPKKDYICTLFIKFDKSFDKHSEKSVTWYINKA